MPSPIRKPRVFISYSRKDAAFIHQLEADLRASLCDPWIDDMEIRHGKPWLDEIFASGMPSCEVVLCYLTAFSLQSDMVKREIDARLVERLGLANEQVHFLLYLAEEDLRPALRTDLQTLHAPILNSTNYREVLPRLVAEIWRCYSESLLVQTIQMEKGKRLDLEARLRELERTVSPSIFSAAETAEFTAIWKSLDVPFSATVQLVERNTSNVIADKQCTLSFGALYRASIATETIKPSSYALQHAVGSALQAALSIDGSGLDARFAMPIDYESAFLRFGFLERHARPARGESRIVAMMSSGYDLVFTPKFDRFNFWLENTYPVTSQSEGLLLKVE